MESCFLPAAGHRVSEGEQAAADSALPPAHLQTAGRRDGRPRAGLPADESLQAHDQGRPTNSSGGSGSSSHGGPRFNRHIATPSCLRPAAVLPRVGWQELPAVSETEQEQRADGPKVQADDHQKADDPEQRYSHSPPPHSTQPCSFMTI